MFQRQGFSPDGVFNCLRNCRRDIVHGIPERVRFRQHGWTLFQVGVFFHLYRALLVTGLREPFDLIFRELRQAQEAISKAHDNLEEHVRERTAELRAGEEKYRALIESANDAVFIHEINEDGMPGPFLEVNELACRQLGYGREELAGMSPWNSTTPHYDSKEEMTRLDLSRDVYANLEDRNRLLSVIDKKGSGEYEVFLKKKNGETMLARISLAVVRNYDGNIMGCTRG